MDLFTICKEWADRINPSLGFKLSFNYKHFKKVCFAFNCESPSQEILIYYRERLS
jgi:hypothetical protein